MTEDSVLVDCIMIRGVNVNSYVIYTNNKSFVLLI